MRSLDTGFAFSADFRKPDWWLQQPGRALAMRPR